MQTSFPPNPPKKSHRALRESVISTGGAFLRRSRETPVFRFFVCRCSCLFSSLSIPSSARNLLSPVLSLRKSQVPQGFSLWVPRPVRKEALAPRVCLPIPTAAAILLLACITLTASAQTLARPGWAGSGLTPEPWWRHAVLYRIDTPQLPTLTQLPSLQAFGIDALLLTDPSSRPETERSANPADRPADEPATTAPEPAQPLTVDDLLFECSRLHIRVLIPLDLAEGANLSNTLALARSWLNRGAAGFVLLNLHKPEATINSPSDIQPASTRHPAAVHAIHLTTATPDPQIVADLHQLLTQFPGDRILIGSDSTPATASMQLRLAPLDAAPNPNTLSNIAAQTAPRALVSLPQIASLTPIDATRLLASTAPAILDSSALPAELLTRVFPPLTKLAEEPATPAPTPPPTPPTNVYGAYTPYIQKDIAAERRQKSAAAKAQQDAQTIAADTFPIQPMYQPITDTPEGHIAFYHRLIQLHRANQTLHDGTLQTIDNNAQTPAWAITRPGNPTLVIVINTTPTPTRIDLSNALRSIGTPREKLRTLLHTAAASGVFTANAITVGPQGVYIGELVAGYTYR